MTKPHRKLCDSLAQACAESGKRTYVELRPAAWQTRPTGIPDVLAMSRFAYGPTTWSLIAYEVKVSRADFLRDVKAGKWMRYVSELGIQRVMFAAPKGLVAPEEVPPEAGLIVYDASKGTWRVARTGRVLQNDIRKVNIELLLAMLDNTSHDRIAAVERHGRLRRVATAVQEQVGKIADEDLRSFASVIGHEFAERASKKRKNETEVAKINEWAEKVLALLAECRGVEVEQLRSEISHGYGADTTKAVLLRAQHAATRMEEINQVAQLLEGLSDYRQDDDSWRLKHCRPPVEAIQKRLSA